MRRVLFSLLAIALCSSLFAQENGPVRRASRRGEGSGYSSRDATVLSMMGWGVGIAVGIAAICALIDNETGGGGHAHGGSNNSH